MNAARHLRRAALAVFGSDLRVLNRPMDETRRYAGELGAFSQRQLGRKIKFTCNERDITLFAGPTTGQTVSVLVDVAVSVIYM
jgi:hypothetical protein